MKKLHVGHLLGGLCLLSLGLTFGMLVKDSYASRNAAGTMTGINGPYVAGTTISSSVVNARLADIETEITDSLDRSGKGGMLAALRGTDGTAAAPALSFTSETGTGLYRIGSGDLGLAVSGAKIMDWNSVAGGPAETITLAGSASASAGNWFAASLADGNVVNLWMGKSTAAGSSGKLTYTKNATAANSTYCMGVVGGSDSTLCVDGNNKTLLGGGTAIGGYRMKAGTAGCATAAAAGATCDTTVTWPTAFADANYNAWCVAGGTVTSGVPVVQILNSYLAATVNVRTVAITAAAAQFGSFDCFAFHQ